MSGTIASKRQQKSDPKRTAVIGAGGSTGRECVKRLAELRVPVRAVVRSPEKYKGQFPEGVEVVAGDVTDEASLHAALEGCRAVIFAASNTTNGDSAQEVCHHGAAATALAAKAVGAKVVLVTSRLVNGKKFGWWFFRMFLNKLTNGGMDAKMQGEDAVRLSGADYCIIRPGGLVYGEEGKTHSKTDLSPAGGDCLLPSAADSLENARGPHAICRVDLAAVCAQAVLRSDWSRQTLEIVACPRDDEDAPFAQQLCTLFDGIPKDSEVYPELYLPAEETRGTWSRALQCLPAGSMGRVVQSLPSKRLRARAQRWFL